MGLPVTVKIEGTVKATEVTVPVPAGKSAATSALNVGAAAAPVVGPAQNELAACVVSVKVNAGVVVGLVTEVVATASKFPALKLVTVPLVGTYAEMLPEPSTWKVTLVFPPGAAGVVPLKLGLAITEPLTFTEDEPPPTAASMRIKFSTTTASAPHNAKPRFVEYCASPPGYISDILFSYRLVSVCSTLHHLLFTLVVKT
jgi:hypothetical protein